LKKVLGRWSAFPLQPRTKYTFYIEIDTLNSEAFGSKHLLDGAAA
jgi:hypothetical protein